MAAAIAKQVLGNRINADSAGIDVGQSKASRGAIKIMQEYGLNITSHRPREISSVELNAYDFVVALSSVVEIELSKRPVMKRSKLITWEIDDPYGKGLAAYRKCANSIKKSVPQLMPLIRQEEAPNAVEAIPSPTSRSDLPNQLKELQNYVRNAIRRLNQGALSGSHLVGVGSKSVDLFDAVLRELLRFYLELASVNYIERLTKVVGSKSVDELTMGQVIVCLRTLDAEITKVCRLNISNVAKGLANRRLFTPRIEKTLTEITKARNAMHHHLPIFAKDEVTLVKKVKTLLEHLESVLADPLCVIPIQLSES
jgi:protein-tyrosine-phosphatase